MTGLRTAAEKARHDVTDAIKAVTPLSIRRALVRARLAARRWTSSGRLLPDFVILGGMRCGTSSLYKYLSRHPEVAPSLRKEVEYFTINHHLGMEWYRAHFPLRIRRTIAARRGHQLQTFEATPDYLFDPRSPAWLTEALPEARLIVLLRDPALRAHSHYHHNVRHRVETESFARAIDLEPLRLQGDLEAIVVDPDDRALNLRRYSYVSRGLYGEQLARWFDYADPARFLVLESERFFADPGGGFAEILEFLGLSPWSPPEFRNYSYTIGMDAGYPPLDAGMRRRLDERFAADHERLRQILGRDLAWKGDPT